MFKVSGRCFSITAGKGEEEKKKSKSKVRHRENLILEDLLILECPRYTRNVFILSGKSVSAHIQVFSAMLRRSHKSLNLPKTHFGQWPDKQKGFSFIWLILK